MKKIIGFLLLFSGLYFPVMAQTKATITITNPSKSDRTNVVVPVSWSNITAKYSLIDTAGFKVVNSVTKKEIPFQLERPWASYCSEPAVTG